MKRHTSLALLINLLTTFCFCVENETTTSTLDLLQHKKVEDEPQFADDLKSISEVPGFCSKDKLCCGDDFITSPMVKGKIYLRPKAAAQSTGSWYQNVEYCRNRCAEMVTIQSEDENAFVKTWLRSVGITSEGAWLGGQIVNAAKNIQWLNGDPTQYSNWQAGEPSEPGIMCLHFGFSNTLTWWDYYCTETQAVAILCQRQWRLVY